jgi:hypothetical protein
LSSVPCARDEQHSRTRDNVAGPARFRKTVIRLEIRGGFKNLDLRLLATPMRSMGVNYRLDRRIGGQAVRVRLAGGSANSPINFGIGADPGHHEPASPAPGCRSTVRRSIALLVPQPGQNTSSHGVPASSAARMVGDYRLSRSRASCPFHRSTTASASARAALSAAFRLAPNPHDGSLALLILKFEIGNPN